MEPVSGCILAGGKSARMGVDKANLVLGEKTFLEIQIDTMRELQLKDIMVSGQRGSLPHVRYVEDRVKDMGPLAGLQACFAEAACPDCLVLSVDVPLIPRAATLLIHEGKAEPLIGVYKTDLCDKIAQLLQGSDRSVRALLKRIDYQTVPYEDDPALLMNCNTPEEYRLLLRLWETNHK